MDRNYISNCVLNAPGLAEKEAQSPTIKVSNTIRIKVNGVLSLLKTPSDTPSLALAKGVNGKATTNLPKTHYRIYTLLGEITEVGEISYSWVHSKDVYHYTLGRTEWVNTGNIGDENKAVIGHAIIFNLSEEDFVPGTTNINENDISVEFIDQFGFVGM